MKNITGSKTILIAVALLALFGLMAGTAAQAEASYYTAAQDRTYVALVNASGVPLPTLSSQTAAIYIGHQIADAVAANPTDSGFRYVTLTALQAAREAGFSAYTTPSDAKVVAVMLVAAVHVYEPALVPALQHFIDGLGSNGASPASAPVQVVSAALARQAA
jgi:hypothetical protein